MSKPPFQQLVDDHWRDVARLAYGLAGPDGEDVAQQAWLNALKAYPSVKSTANLRGWLLTITHRCAMDHFRRRKKDAVPSEDVTAVGREPQSPPADSVLPDTELWSAVQRLPLREREAVCLRYLADQEHRTIAAELNISPEMSRRLVSDAVKKLRMSYSQEGA